MFVLCLTTGCEAFCKTLKPSDLFPHPRMISKKGPIWLQQTTQYLRFPVPITYKGLAHWGELQTIPLLTNSKAHGPKFWELLQVGGERFQSPPLYKRGLQLQSPVPTDPEPRYSRSTLHISTHCPRVDAPGLRVWEAWRGGGAGEGNKNTGQRCRVPLFQESWRDPERYWEHARRGRGAYGREGGEQPSSVPDSRRLARGGPRPAPLVSLVRSKGRAWERRQHSPAPGAWRLVSTRPLGPQTFKPVR